MGFAGLNVVSLALTGDGAFGTAGLELTDGFVALSELFEPVACGIVAGLAGTVDLAIGSLVCFTSGAFAFMGDFAGGVAFLGATFGAGVLVAATVLVVATTLGLAIGLAGVFVVVGLVLAFTAGLDFATAGLDFAAAGLVFAVTGFDFVDAAFLATAFLATAFLGAAGLAADLTGAFDFETVAGFLAFGAGLDFRAVFDFGLGLALVAVGFALTAVFFTGAPLEDLEPVAFFDLIVFCVAIIDLV